MEDFFLCLDFLFAVISMHHTVQLVVERASSCIKVPARESNAPGSRMPRRCDLAQLGASD